MKLNTSIRKKYRVSNKVKKVASKDRFRLSISRSSKNITAQIIDDAKMLEKIGCFGIVLEKIPALLSKKIAEIVKIPVIGIGAGKDVDGQVLVLHDMLGMTQDFSPRFLRRYLDLKSEIIKAIRSYTSDVKLLKFPSDSEQY